MLENDSINEQSELDELLAEYSTKESEKEPNKHYKKNPDYEKSIEKILFGDKKQLIRNLKQAIKTEKHVSDLDNQGNENSEKKSHKRKSVWTDPDDENILLGEVKKPTKHTGPLDHLKTDQPYKEYLDAKFTRIVNPPKWVSLAVAKKNLEKSDSDNEEDEELLRTVGFLNKKAETTLEPNNIKIKKLKDLNRATYAEGFINCIDFHPTSTAALVVGEKCIASIYAVDGTTNDKLHNIYIPTFPIKCAKILPCGTKAILGSVTRYGYIYDLLTAQESCYKIRKDHGNLRKFRVSPCGKYFASIGYDGDIHLWESKSFELIHTFKQNEDGASLCFTGDSTRLICSSRSPEVYIFSLRQRRLEHRFSDDGCIKGNVMDLSPNQRLLATGSMEGVVNVYDFNKVMTTTTPTPDKVLLNLKTAISDVKFNYSSELLGFCSSKAPGAVKLVHFPSATVYANFPVYSTNKLGKIRTLSFSPQSAYLALGTFKEVPLFRLKHYANY